MTLEQQVCSLELAKRLAKLGVMQRSLLYWWCLKGKWSVSYSRPHPQADFRDEPWYSAFTVAELGEMLPEIYASGSVHFFNNPKAFKCWDNHIDSPLEHLEYADKEADARAKMLIYLLENKLIDNV